MYPVFRDVKASGLYFLVYSYTLDKLRLGEPSRESTGPEIFFAGGMAGRSNHEWLSRILERLVNNFRETKLYISYETKTTIGVDIVYKHWTLTFLSKLVYLASVIINIRAKKCQRF